MRPTTACVAAVPTALLALTLTTGAASAGPGGEPGRPDNPGNGKHGNGSLNSPQPPSNADFTGHGANTHGPYDSTRDGSPSLNGNGGGEANGKPCAGCVGKADNKNPPGQLPGGSDANAGYECDRNHGVGKGNPAHTGCVPGHESPNGEPSGGELEPPKGSEAGPADLPALPVVAPVAQPAPAPAAPEVVSASPDDLAFTGFALEPALLASLILLGAGAAVVATTRRIGRE